MPRFKIGKIIFEDGSTTDATVEFEASSNISIINEDKDGDERVVILSKTELMTLFYAYVGWERGVQEYKKLTEH